MSAKNTVAVAFDAGIAWVAMNRPEKKNAISIEMAREMVEVFDSLEVDKRCQVVVLTGAGESFSAGMDLKDYFRATDNKTAVERARVYRTNAAWQWRGLLHYPKPTIAMVNGWCFGGAFTPLWPATSPLRPTRRLSACRRSTGASSPPASYARRSRP